MANQENTRTPKQENQPPQQAQTGDNKNTDKTGRPVNKDPRFAPGQSARQPDQGGGSRH